MLVPITLCICLSKVGSELSWALHGRSYYNVWIVPCTDNTYTHGSMITANLCILVSKYHDTHMIAFKSNNAVMIRSRISFSDPPPGWIPKLEYGTQLTAGCRLLRPATVERLMYPRVTNCLDLTNMALVLPSFTTLNYVWYDLDWFLLLFCNCTTFISTTLEQVMQGQLTARILHKSAKAQHCAPNTFSIACCKWLLLHMIVLRTLFNLQGWSCVQRRLQV